MSTTPNKEQNTNQKFSASGSKDMKSNPSHPANQKGSEQEKTQFGSSQRSGKPSDQTRTSEHKK